MKPSKRYQKLPGRTLIRLLRSSNPLGQTAAGTGLSEAEKAAIVFTDKIKELITGVILGDGYIRMVGTEARLEVQQKDKEFVLLLWEVFDSIGLVGAKPKELSSFLKETGKTYYASKFVTFTHPYFTDLYNNWYTKVEGKNVKVIPNDCGLTQRVGRPQ